jgi:O-methyltransferase
MVLTQLVKSAFRFVGLDLRRLPAETVNLPGLPDQPEWILPDQPEWINDIIAYVRPYTMTGPERVAALCQAVAHIERHGIAGDIVECGVWRGGSMMAAALTLLRSRPWRALHLYDTFEGMSEPTSVDLHAASGQSAKELLAATTKDKHLWARSTLDEVSQNLALTNYPDQLIKCIVGKVEDTIPSYIPTRIALLRLDTDWYESTKHELTYLWPRLVNNGILIIDDYGHWTGARKAVDEFLESAGSMLFLNRIDHTGRLIIKP